jgi:steroid delta-isomerase-like uncharacterized protein
MFRRDELVSIARSWIEIGWCQGRADVVDDLHAPDFVDHDSAGRPSDNEGFKQGIVRLFEAFPDFQAKVRGLVVNTDTGQVAVRWTATGTHRGEYLGAPPTGRQVTFKGIEIIRIRDERIVERWGEWDGMGLLEQLGLWKP